MYHGVLVSLGSAVHSVHWWCPVLPMDCELPTCKCLFTPGVHFLGAQQSKNDLTLWCCRNTNSNKAANPPQRLWVHTQLSKACCSHPIQGLQSNSFGPDSPFLMSLINPCRRLHLQAAVCKHRAFKGGVWALSCEKWWTNSRFSHEGFDKPYRQFVTAWEAHRQVSNGKGNKTSLKAGLFSS